MRPFSVLPHPEDVSPAPRVPFAKQDGIYLFYREPGDTAVFIQEPCEDSYILEWFEFETFLKCVLQMEEDTRNRLLDMVWNFYSVALNTVKDRAVVLRSPDRGEWESEIQLQFREGK